MPDPGPPEGRGTRRWSRCRAALRRPAGSAGRAGKPGRWGPGGCGNRPSPELPRSRGKSCCVFCLYLHHMQGVPATECPTSTTKSATRSRIGSSQRHPALYRPVGTPRSVKTATGVCTTQTGLQFPSSSAPLVTSSAGSRCAHRVYLDETKGIQRGRWLHPFSKAKSGQVAAPGGGQQEQPRGLVAMVFEAIDLRFCRLWADPATCCSWT
jgi:hypothetical protein